MWNVIDGRTRDPEISDVLTRQSLRRLGITDERIDTLTMHEVLLELITSQAVLETQRQRSEEEAWLARASQGSASLVRMKMEDLTDTLPSVDALGGG